MRVLIATDAWHPQVNGVVRTLTSVAAAAPALGATIEFITPEGFPTIAMPTYPSIRLAIPAPWEIARRIARVSPDAIHIATEGPIGHAVRHYCRKRGLPFTTSFHTRLPDYIAARLPIPKGLTKRWSWAWLRWFHRPAKRVMTATPTLAAELARRGFRNVALWSRGVDDTLFRPRADADLGVARPVFLFVGRVSVEKNIAEFLALDLPGTKVVVGDGPLREHLTRQFPDTRFLGGKEGEDLATIYAAADVFVFPSRTDTFGLVLLEALASGVPVAAFPVRGPRDVIGAAPVGALDADLKAACLRALGLSRTACRAFALTMSWESSARRFLDNVAVTSPPVAPEQMPIGADIAGERTELRPPSVPRQTVNPR
jgi:glycosyltransferase involved in cell wall biosynthesis